MNMQPELWVPIIGTIAGCAMVAIIIAIIFWHRTRVKELEAHREMRIREMEHERSLKEIELQKVKLELDKARVLGGQPAPR
ncbi:MAG: hypothetical protein ACRD3D_03485 [Terriglobia bacterium]